MAFRPVYRPPVKKPDPVRRSCQGLLYFLALAVIAFLLFSLIDTRVGGLTQLLELGRDFPYPVLAAVGSLIILLILHLLVLFTVAIVRGARADDTRP